ncbi:MAG: diadenylate cyclase CdaA [Verrucomicrobia bacterium]|nr:diadenylate cyclase CdaA [Verrucomicrobiota bacterium]
MWSWLQFIDVGGIIQVIVLAVAYYYIFLFFRGTRGAQVLVGFALVLAILIGLTSVFNLEALNWLLRRLSVFLGVALLIIFQPEIRRALAELGKQPVFAVSSQKRSVVDHIVQAVTVLADHRIGALIAVEREIGTRAIQETGIKLDAPVVPELLATIFFPHTPLHDGGVIIQGSRMQAAGCVFPLSQNPEIHKQLGTRHRAAVGLSEETDAVVVVVSEETGSISVCYRGRLSRGLDRERLSRFLTALLVRGQQSGSVWKRAQEKLDLTPEGIAKSENLTGEGA